MDDPALVLHPIGPGRLSAHGTAVAMGDRGLLILGPSGAGKSGLAAQLMGFGATCVSDDMVHLVQDGPNVRLTAPPNAPPLIELRGLGLAPVTLTPNVRLTRILRLDPSTARLPEAEVLEAFDAQIPVDRHPYRFDLAAKVLVWLGREAHGAG